MTSPQAQDDGSAPEPVRQGRDATMVIAAVAALVGVLLGGVVIYFIGQQQMGHSDRVRLQQTREVAYMAFIDQGQTTLETLAAIKPNDANSAAAAINASRKLDDDLTAIQVVGTHEAVSSAFAVWRAVSDALAQVLNGKIAGSDAVNLQAIGITRATFLEVARADIGFDS